MHTNHHIITITVFAALFTIGPCLHTAVAGDNAPYWSPCFGRPGVYDMYDPPVVRAIAVSDSRGGPLVYLGGNFDFAGGYDEDGIPAANIVQWDGCSFSALGDGTDGGVDAAALFDDGAGPVLYVGGDFDTAGGVAVNNIARWDGQTWSTLGDGTNNRVYALHVHDDGSGPALFVGGRFTSVDGQPCNSRVAKWDGAVWTPINEGVTGISVTTMTTFAEQLYVGGGLNDFGGFISIWDGTTWSGLPYRLDSLVYALVTADAGEPGGPALYAGGMFTEAEQAGGPNLTVNHVAKWDGTTWTSLGTGTDHHVRALEYRQGRGGPLLYAGGGFSTAGGQPADRVAQWDGAAWSELSGTFTHPSNPWVYALKCVGLGDTESLFVGGSLSMLDHVIFQGIVEWNGDAWHTLGKGLRTAGTAMTVFDDGSGPALYLAGDFVYDHFGIAEEGIVRWNGTEWQAIPSVLSSLDEILVMTVFDDGDGPALYAAGDFTTIDGVAANHIAKWDGTTWSALGEGITHYDRPVYALAVYDDGSGPALFVGGTFRYVAGDPVYYIAKWDGSQWSPLGESVNNSVSALAVYDDGDGPVLYVAGSFTSAGGNPAAGLAKWDGADWHPVETSAAYIHVDALTVFDDGTGGGPALYAGGSFTEMGGQTVNHIAKWNGTEWSPLGDGLGSSYVYVNAFAVADDGSGDGRALYVAGAFEQAGGVEVNNIARWDGQTWSDLDLGTDGEVDALALYDTCGEAALYLSGSFLHAGGIPSARIAQWVIPTQETLIDVHPSGQAVCRLDPASFHVAAFGPPPLTYQWRREGEAIPGATWRQLTLDGVTVDDEGSYDCVVTSACDVATSDAALLSITLPTVGDLNCDCHVDNFDIGPFVLAVARPEDYALAYPDCDYMLADCNDDGAVNNFDISPFVDLLAPDP
ncbi:MAG: immunoglobulin domain-containing protein [Phycisphaerae bacterium]|jgi:hypothetical protein